MHNFYIKLSNQNAQCIENKTRKKFLRQRDVNSPNDGNNNDNNEFDHDDDNLADENMIQDYFDAGF